MKVDAGKIVELVRKMKPLFADSSRVSQVKEKGTCDYVTQVDIQVQKLVKEGLYSMYPQVQFMGEEQDNSAIDRSGDFWILDPVDGTTNRSMISVTVPFHWLMQRLVRWCLELCISLIQMNCLLPKKEKGHF